jgi:hypothetical protein
MIRRLMPVFAIVLVAGCSQDAPTGAGPAALDASAAASGRGALGSDFLAELAQVRRTTARYHDIDAAMADGYTVWSPDPYAPNATCPSSPAGNMGYHLVNVSLRGGAADPAAGDVVIDPLHPEMLLYERRADGQMHLVGVEYIVFQAAWERVYGAGAAPPELFGETFPFSTHTFVAGGPSIPHYELHIWLWTSNPLGLIGPWNPTVTC